MKSNQFYVWEQHNITLIKTHDYGYGIAISGGHKNENEVDEETHVIVSDVLKNGPADGKLQVNDKILLVNGVNVENVEHEFVARLLKESKDFINIQIKRKVFLLNEQRINHDLLREDLSNFKKIKISLRQKDQKLPAGIVLGCKYYIKDIIPQTLADSHDIDAKIGDLITKINDTHVDQLSLVEAKKLVSAKTKDGKLSLTLLRAQSESPHKKHETLLQPIYQTNTHANKIEYRTIVFQRDTGIGVRIAGGNRVGIYVCDVQFNSPAERAGLKVGDKIFKVNEVDYVPLTREQAVQHLVSLTSTIQMYVANMPNEYESSAFDPSGGDSFYIRAHFNFTGTQENELSFKINDILHVTDTLYNGVIGNWIATRLSLNDDEQNSKGIIPNLSTAEKLAKNAPTIDQLANLNTKSTFKSRFRASKRSKSHTRDDPLSNLKVSKANSHQNCKYIAYERVILKEINFKRPIVIFGPLADVGREKLKCDYPEKYEIPESYSNSSELLQQQSDSGGGGGGGVNGGVIKVASIKQIIQKGKHCLLDITPNAVDHLNYANFFPIVINLKAESRAHVKELRQKYAKHYKPKSSKRIYENSEKLQKMYSHLFTRNISLENSNWYRKLKETIDSLQHQPVWVSEEQSLETTKTQVKKRTFMDDNFELQVYNRNTYDTQSTNQSSYESENEYSTRPTSLFVTHVEKDQSTNGAPIQRFNSDSNLYQENDVQHQQQQQQNANKYMTFSSKQNNESYYRIQQEPHASMVRSSHMINHKQQEYENYSQFDDASNTSFTRQKSFNQAINGLHNNQKTFASLQQQQQQQLQSSSTTASQCSSQADNRGQDAYRYVSRSTAMPCAQSSSNLVLAAAASKKPPPPPILPKPSKSLSSAILTQKKLKSKSELNINSACCIPNDDKTQTFLTKINAFNSLNVNKNLNRVHHQQSIASSSQISSSQGYHSDTMDSSDQKTEMLVKIESNTTSGSLSTISTNSNNLSPLTTTNSDAQITPPRMSKSLIAFNGSHNQSISSKSYHDLATHAQSLYMAHYNDNGLYKRIQIESDFTFLVISSELGLFDANGGLLESKETGVSLQVPENALSKCQSPSEIYIKICLCKSLENLRNPLVLCGPRGIRFTRPVKLHIPLFKSIDGKSWSYVPKSMTLDSQVPTKSVDVLIDYF